MSLGYKMKAQLFLSADRNLRGGLLYLGLLELEQFLVQKKEFALGLSRDEIRRFWGGDDGLCPPPWPAPMPVLHYHPENAKSSRFKCPVLKPGRQTVPTAWNRDWASSP